MSPSPRASLLAILALCAWGCSKEETAATSGDGGSDAEALLASSGEQKKPEGRLFPSRRCGECHGRQHREWSDSAHARTNGESFQAVLAQVPADAKAGCSGCHAPLELGGRRVAKDGVGCDACHTATAPGDGKGPHALTLSPQLATRFGPYRDSKDHHFHRVGFSEFVVGDGLCASCHQDAPGTAVPQYTTVAEAQANPERVECNACHMPPMRAVAAKGEQVRSVSRHDFHPDKRAALEKALSLRFAVDSGRKQAKVSLTNDGAGHHLPTGRPERRLVLELEWRDAADAPLTVERREYGRRLVDAEGALAPSFLAVKEAEDVRLVSGAAREETFSIPSKARSAQVRLRYERFDAQLASVFGRSEPLLILERREAL